MKGMHIHTVKGPAEPCRWYCRIFCFFGLHRWDSPDGQCECCEAKDELFTYDP